MTKLAVPRRVEPASTPFHIALLDIDRSAPERVAFHALLSPDEAAYANAFRAQRDRDRFIVRRGWLRSVLAEIVGGSPGMLRFATNAFGKPYLPDQPEVRFSTSHSAGAGLLVVAHGREIGCDIERCDPALAAPEVAERLFSVQERAALAALADEAWVDGFFNCWTRKEAYVKALGMGLSHPLHGFSVSLVPGEPARLINAAPGWELVAPEVTEGFKAAVVFACREE